MLPCSALAGSFLLALTLCRVSGLCIGLHRGGGGGVARRRWRSARAEGSPPLFCFSFSPFLRPLGYGAYLTAGGFLMSSSSLRFTVWPEGSLLRLSSPRSPSVLDDLPASSPSSLGVLVDSLDSSVDLDPSVIGGLRGVVDRLSPASRLRLMAKIATVPRPVPSHFVTLTYPGLPDRWDSSFSEFGPPVPLPGPRASKRDLDTYWKRIIRRFPSASAIWKLEPQERGVPHFHLLIYGLPSDSPDLDCWLRSAWHDLVGRGDPHHVLRGFDMEYLADDSEKARRYLSKYVAKDEVLSLNPDCGEFAGMSPGRFWGVLNKNALPVSSSFDFDIPPELSRIVSRVVRRLQFARVRHAHIGRLGRFYKRYLRMDADPFQLHIYRALALKFRANELKRPDIYPNPLPRPPAFRNPLRRVPFLSLNFTSDPKRLLDDILRAGQIMVSKPKPPPHSTPPPRVQKLAGPRGPLPG